MKTNKGLVAYCRAQLGRPYWFGTFGQIADEKLLKQKADQYPRNFSEKRQAVAKAKHLGQKVHDCYGLPKGYLMSESPDAPAVYDPKLDKSADDAFKSASESGTIVTLPEIEGIGLWKKGHVGVYIGNGREIEARGFDYGVVEDDVANTKFTHWFKIPNIEYDAQTPSNSGETAPVSAPSDSSVEVYIVKEGDTLGKISAKFGIAVSDLVRWNNILNPDLIMVGQEIALFDPLDDPDDYFLGKVTTNFKPLNIRSGSGTNHPVIGTLPRGAEVKIAYETGEWGKLYGREGFVSMKFITKI